MFKPKGHIHNYEGVCINPICRLKQVISLTSWEFKLLDIIQCRRCGEDIPAGNFKEVILDDQK